MVYQRTILSKPGPLRIQGKEARVARQTVHQPPITMTYVGTGRRERLGGRAASGALSAFAGLFEDYGVRWVRSFLASTILL